MNIKTVVSPGAVNDLALPTDGPSEVAPPLKRRRGFGHLAPEKRRQIARMGGRQAHQNGTAHTFTPEEARAAGRKGGDRVSQDRGHMAVIGRQGGLKRWRKRAAADDRI